MGADLSQLGAEAEGLLQSFVSAWASLSADPGWGSLPQDPSGSTVAYCAPGAGVPWDGEALIMQSLGIHPGGANAADMRPMPVYMMRQAAVFALWLIRQVALPDDAGLPSPNVIDQDGQASINDAGMLWKAGLIVKAGIQPGQGEDFTLNLAPVGPEGGLMATRLDIEWTAD